LVKLVLADQDKHIYLNPDMVQFVAYPIDKDKKLLIGHALVYTLTEKIVVKGTPEEVAALLGSRFTEDPEIGAN